MPDQKISELNAAGPITGTEVVPVSQGTNTVKVPLSTVIAALASPYDDTALQAAVTALQTAITNALVSTPAAGTNQQIVPGAPADVPLAVKASGGQSGDLFQALSPTGTTLFRIDANGNVTIPGNLTVTGNLGAVRPGAMQYKGTIDPTGPYTAPAGIISGWYYTASVAGAVDPSWSAVFESAVTNVGVGDVLIYDGSKFVHMRNNSSVYDDTGLQAAVAAIQAGVALTDTAGNQRGTLKFVEATGDLELTLTDASGTKQGVIKMHPDGSVEFPNAPTTASGAKTLITNEMLAAKLIEVVHPHPAAGSPQEIVTGAIGDVPLTLKGVAGQTANLFEVKNAAGTVLFKIAPNGAVTIPSDATIQGDVTITGTLNANVAGAMIYKGAIDPTAAYAALPGIQSGWYYTSSGAGQVHISWGTNLEASVTSVGIGDVLIYDGSKFIHMRNQVAPAIEPVQVLAVGYDQAVVVDDGVGYFHIAPSLDGKDLVSVHAAVITAGTGGLTSVQIRNLTKGVDMLTTMMTIDSGETGSDTAAAAAVISNTDKTVAVNDMLRLDVKTVNTTTAPLGLLVTMEFK